MGRSGFEFVKFAKKTMQRYEELNRKIQSFRLRIRNRSPEIYDVYAVLQSQTLVRLSLKDQKQAEARHALKHMAKGQL
ncbi:hypothetical protein ACS0TY_014131 [Phlomoides rotata]